MWTVVINVRLMILLVLQGSQSYARALAQVGVLTSDEAEEIIGGLSKVEFLTSGGLHLFWISKYYLADMGCSYNALSCLGW